VVELDEGAFKSFKSVKELEKDSNWLSFLIDQDFNRHIIGFPSLNCLIPGGPKHQLTKAAILESITSTSVYADHVDVKLGNHPYFGIYYNGASFDDQSGDWAVMGEDGQSVDRITLVEVLDAI